MLARHGIFSLLDFHQDLYNERFGGEGWPDWAVLDDGVPAEPLTGFPGSYLTSPGLNRAFDNFWANSPAPAASASRTATPPPGATSPQRFRRRPYVMGYDLLNEPWPGQRLARPAPTPRAARVRHRSLTAVLPAGDRARSAQVDRQQPHLVRARTSSSTSAPTPTSPTRRPPPRVQLPRLLPHAARRAAATAPTPASSSRSWSSTTPTSTPSETGDAPCCSPSSAPPTTPTSILRDRRARRPPHGLLAVVALLRLRRPDDPGRPGRQAGDRHRPRQAAARAQRQAPTSSRCSPAPTRRRSPAPRSSFGFDPATPALRARLLDHGARPARAASGAATTDVFVPEIHYPAATASGSAAPSSRPRGDQHLSFGAPSVTARSTSRSAPR